LSDAGAFAVRERIAFELVSRLSGAQKAALRIDERALGDLPAADLDFLVTIGLIRAVPSAVTHEAPRWWLTRSGLAVRHCLAYNSGL
jgi:hypothetical protein